MIFDRRNGHNSQEETTGADDGGGGMSERRKPRHDDERQELSFSFSFKSTGLRKTGQLAAIGVLITTVVAAAVKLVEILTKL